MKQCWAAYIVRSCQQYTEQNYVFLSLQSDVQYVSTKTTMLNSSGLPSIAVNNEQYGQQNLVQSCLYDQHYTGNIFCCVPPLQPFAFSFFLSMY